MNVIDSFTEQYEFLSNFYPSKIIVEDIPFPTVEHYFQAAKTLSMEEYLGIAAAKTPGEAKRLGRSVNLRPDWEKVKEDQMKFALRLKFSNPELRERLIATGDATLIEGNWWHDNYWGSCNCPKCGGRGKNRLGHLLMELREELKN